MKKSKAFCVPESCCWKLTSAPPPSVRLNTPDGYQQLAVQKLAEVSGLPVVPAEDLIEATSDCGAYVMVHSSLKRLAVKLSKICNDLRLLSSGPRAAERNQPAGAAGGFLDHAGES
jgi:aspartate ammonia-lyase